MNVNINDYCYPAFPYVIGFAATVHDPKSQPLLRFQQQIDLTAGFASNVDIIEKKIEMTTESYNYCSSRYNYTLGHPGDNHKSICMKECLTLEVWHHCGCILYYSPQLTYWKLMTAPFHMKNVTDKEYSGGPRRHQRFQFCHAIDVDCVQPIERRGVGVNGVCTQRCPTSCKQKKFQFGISQSRFPTPKLMNYIRKQLNFSSNYSLKAARLNLISANFFYSSAVNKLEQVDIAMTWVDLTAQLGGALGLTIGASLLSLVEIINWLIWQLGTIFSTLARIACCPVRKLEPKIYHHSVSR